MTLACDRRFVLGRGSIAVLATPILASCGSRSNERRAEQGGTLTGNSHTEAEVKPFPADLIRDAARGTSFKPEAAHERAVADLLEYYDIEDTPRLARSSPTILGRAIFKKVAIVLREGVSRSIAAGDYIHWAGPSGGVWLAGFSAIRGDASVPADIKFSVEQPINQGHPQTYTHDPASALALRAQLAAAAENAGPIPGPGPVPPRPPICWEVCKKVIDIDTGQEMWSVTGWIRI